MLDPAPSHAAIADPAPMVRPARVADLGALFRLEQQTFSHDRMSRDGMARLLNRSSAAWRVVESADGIAGYALVLFRRGSRVARLYSIALSADARGHGLGRALLQAAEQAAAERGANRMRLEVRPDNAAAIALYQTAGYRNIGRYPAFYEDGSGALRLEKALPAG